MVSTFLFGVEGNSCHHFPWHLTCLSGRFSTLEQLFWREGNKSRMVGRIVNAVLPSRGSGKPDPEPFSLKKGTLQSSVSLEKRNTTLDVLWSRHDVSNVVRHKDIVWQEEPPCVLKVCVDCQCPVSSAQVGRWVSPWSCPTQFRC